jgi:hypothetical protein
MTRAVLLILALLGALTFACGGDDDAAQDPDLAARQAHADSIEDDGFLRPPVPRTLPPGLRATGIDLGDATADHIVVSYPPVAPPGTTEPPDAPYLTIVANLDPDGTQPCEDTGSPPYNSECIEVNGEPSALQVTGTPTTVIVFVGTHIGDLSVFVTLDWPASAQVDIPAAEEARAQALSVAENLLVE